MIVTARGNKVDFVSRFFGPQTGVDEDPVTGSAHTTLIPYWAAKQAKTELSAIQLSQEKEFYNVNIPVKGFKSVVNAGFTWPAKFLLLKWLSWRENIRKILFKKFVLIRILFYI